MYIFPESDADITIPKEHYLAFSWTTTTMAAGYSIPYNTEVPLASAYDAPGHAAGKISADGFRKSANFLVLPDFIGCEREGGRCLTLVNEAIRSHAIEGVDRVFDIVEELSQVAPCDNLHTLNICPMSGLNKIKQVQAPFDFRDAAAVKPKKLQT
ncbi:hypothetical protein [Paenibacillus sp. Soil787]|uniref:hypothetical protein n=1 Tax=Paenibacillus sp. Soil787 TaxID=1736411 RepID=UPI0007031450|nr:hypothetical protein [Paenibacillus sp. Soil787]